MAIVITSAEEKATLESFGRQFEEGMTPAFDHDRQLKGVVLDSSGLFKMTFPLNGHRGRNLAEDVLGERNAALWTIGKTMVVPVQSLLDLPGFDQKYYDILETVKTLGGILVVVQVVEVDPGYGCHITIASGIMNSIV